ncbi:MAG: Coenzyme F420 hydrogenase/dehydrogenase, beta subunit C-terminal domain [Desulfobacterales bacterium]|nr:Coenzyme F420 hydrogenase/dehydrogenase, beta subunit C-terminal domain [Desulfobacterales bacterium]
MKTFEDLIEEVQKPGLCHHCGGCVTFCTAINYGALELDADGMPQFADRAKCIECGLCYSICPEIDEMQEETRQVAGWEPPMGRVLDTTVARSTDSTIRAKATDGGVVTALLVHLFDRGHIDGAIVTKQTGPFEREPWLATSREEIIDAAGFYIDSSHGMKHFGHDYSTYSPSVQEFRPMLQKGLRRVALVGTPCQIKALRKMEALGIVPSDSIRYTMGLFCSGNFLFDEKERQVLEQKGGFKWQDVQKVNLRDKLIVQLNTGDKKTIPLSELEFMKRFACHYCPDYAAEYADISFGGIGAEEGWTTVITRSPVGRAILADARGKAVEIYNFKSSPDKPMEVMKKIQTASNRKKKYSKQMHDKLVKGHTA